MSDGTRLGNTSPWVRVTCPECGVVRVRSERVVIRHCVDDGSWSYRARCSACDTFFVGAAPPELALSAAVAGVVIESWTLPRPSRRTPGPPLCEIDALRLHVALREPDWFDEMVRAGRVGDR